MPMDIFFCFYQVYQENISLASENITVSVVDRGVSSKACNLTGRLTKLRLTHFRPCRSETEKKYFTETFLVLCCHNF